MPDLVFVDSNILVYAHDRSNPVGILYSSRTGGPPQDHSLTP